jgi:hypothetical protein
MADEGRPQALSFWDELTHCAHLLVNFTQRGSK